MDLPQIGRDRVATAAYLGSGELSAEIAELLRRWAEPGRPALLLVLDWDRPFVEVYPEDELLETFADMSLAHAGACDEDSMARLLVVVIDEEGEAAYAIPDPRACD